MADKNLNIDVTMKFPGAEASIKGISRNFKDLDKVVKEIGTGLKRFKDEIAPINAATQKIVVNMEKYRDRTARINAEASKLRAELAKIKYETREAIKATKSFNDGFSHLTMSIIKARTALYAMRTAFNLIKNSISAPIEAVDQYQLAVATQAGIITSLIKPTEKVAETYSKATLYVKDVNDFFVKINGNTLATIDQMRTVNRELLKSGILIDTSNQKQIKGFESFVNAIAVFTAGMPDAANQFRQEANSALTGVAGKGREVSNFLASVLGSSWAKITQQWNEDGILLEKFADIFKGFNADISDLDSTWTLLRSTMESTLNDILRKGFEDTYINIMVIVKQLNNYLSENSDIIANKINEGLSTTASVLKYIKDTFVELMFSTEAEKRSLAATKEAIALGEVNRALERRAKTEERLRKKAAESFRTEIPDNELNTTQRARKKVFGINAYKLPSFNDPRVQEEYKRLLQTDLVYLNDANIIEAYNKRMGPVQDKTTKPSSTFDELHAQVKLFKDKLRAQREMEKEVSKGEKIKLSPGLLTKQESVFGALLPSKEDLGIENFNAFQDRIIQGLQEMKEPIETWGRLFRTTIIDLANVGRAFAEDFSNEWRGGLDSIMEKWSESKDTWHTIWNDIMDMTWKKFKETLAKMVAEVVIQMVVIEGLAALLNFAVPGLGTGFKEFLRTMPGLTPKLPKTPFQYATGTDKIMSDKLAMVHQGETIVPAKEAEFLRSGKLALVAAGNSGNSTASGINVIASKLDALASRPIYNVFDFGTEQMVQFSRHLDVANYRRSELRI